MVLQPVGVDGTASTSDVLSGETFNSKTAGKLATGTMSNNGSGDIGGPNDTLSGAGYYSSISNSITDQGVLDINDAYDDGNAGYYDRIDNNITDRGSIGNLSGGDFGSSGYYDSGTVNTSGVQYQKDSYYKNGFTEETYNYNSEELAAVLFEFNVNTNASNGVFNVEVGFDSNTNINYSTSVAAGSSETAQFSYNYLGFNLDFITVNTEDSFGASENFVIKTDVAYY